MILLFNPQSSANRKPILPMSLLAVGAVLEGRHDYAIVDGNLAADALAELDGRIRAAGGAAVLGVTVMPGPQLAQAVPLCRELKQRYPRLTVVWGGYFPTQHWDVCLRADYVDYVVRGHGEFAFAALLAALAGGRAAPDDDTLAGIPGLAYRGADGAPRSNPLAPIPAPKGLPPWNFDRVPVERYVRRTFLGTRTLGYHSSYGCPFFCNFCAVVNMVNGRWLPQTAVQVAHAAEVYQQRWGVNAIEFYDNNFFTQEARVAEFSQRVMGRGLAWWGEGRVDTMLAYAPRTWALMRDAGLKMVFLGAESGSAETLRRMDKGGQMSPEKTLALVAQMAAHGIVPELSFVLGNPPDPEADARGTMDFIRRVKRVNPRTEIILYLYTPVPLAGDLYDEAQAGGFAFPQTLEAWVSGEWLDFSQRRSVGLPWMKRPLHQQLRDFERVLNAYYPTSTDVRLRGWRRWLLRGAAAWRYHARLYRGPLELRVLQRLLAYQRPETSGF
ncbi:MAG: cobalamin-dependent protein [Anaerolineales bacterium]|nr:cobalamin-dependent protein [Anaerolineales bacterium]